VILLIETGHDTHASLAFYQLFNVTLFHKANLETFLTVPFKGFQTLKPDAQHQVMWS
jgi:hypothetical protein